MAQIHEVRLVDDLVGGGADETVAFGLDGKHYEIDLSTANADALRDVLADYVAATRRGAPARTQRSGRAAAAAAPYDCARHHRRRSGAEPCDPRVGHPSGHEGRRTRPDSL